MSYHEAPQAAWLPRLAVIGLLVALVGANVARAEDAGEAGRRFLAENARQPGVVTLPSGLQYQVIVAGSGSKPRLGDVVETHYEGRLIDGTVFDSSVARGEPAAFPVEAVIPGWVEALQLMPVGSKWGCSFRLRSLTANAALAA